MTDRLASDHSSIRTVRATLSETPTGVSIEIPGDDRNAFPAESVVRVDLDGRERFAAIERALTGSDLFVHGIYATPDGARDPRGEADLLPEWVDEHDVRTGGSILLDVVEPDFYYGLRSPGETNYYDAVEAPSESLANIARELEDE